MTFYKRLKWRQQLEDIVPFEDRIGTDILLIRDANIIQANRYIGNQPYNPIIN